MRIVFALAALAGLASAETHTAVRLLPMAEIGYDYDGVQTEGRMTEGTGLKWGGGLQSTFYFPQEDSMGWSLVTELGGDMFSGDLDGAKLVPDLTPSGSSFSQMGFGGTIYTGPFYRVLGLWANSGGLFAANWRFTEGDLAWARDDYALSFGVYSEVGGSPWAHKGIRVGVRAARVGGDQIWSNIFPKGIESDSTEWLLDGFEGRTYLEGWYGPAWGQLIGTMENGNLRHRSEEGSEGETVKWGIGLRVGYRFSWGDLTGFH